MNNGITIEESDVGRELFDLLNDMVEYSESIDWECSDEGEIVIYTGMVESEQHGLKYEPANSDQMRAK